MYSNKSRSSGSFSNNNKGNTDIVVKIDSIARHMLSLEKMFASAGSVHLTSHSNVNAFCKTYCQQ